MMTRQIFIMVSAAAVALIVTGSAQATEWANDFSNNIPFENWTGKEAGAVSAYTDSTGGNIREFNVSFVGTGGQDPKGSDWLTQGQRAGVPTTAKFTHPGIGGTGGGRARFSSDLPTSMDANGGLSFAWVARYGDYAMGRGPVQIAVTDTGADDGSGTEYNAYFRVQDGTTLSIRNNSGGAYGDIDPKNIPNVADGGYHAWSVAVKTADGWAH